MLGEAQKIILLIFSVLLIIIFGIVIWTFVKGGVESWPPTSQTCPDYWRETTPGVCYKSNSNGLCDDATQIDFSNISSCDKYTWSTGGTIDIQTIAGTTANCGVVQWDGINYGNGKYTPCDPGYTPAEL